MPFLKPKKMDHIKYTMDRFGQLVPVLGHYIEDIFYIFDGNVRWQAAKSLGWKTLNCHEKNTQRKM